MNSLVHRGPDGLGFHIDGPVALGHRRLAIIDPAQGQQPMISEDGTIAVSFNGESIITKNYARNCSDWVTTFILIPIPK